MSNKSSIIALIELRLFVEFATEQQKPIIPARHASERPSAPQCWAWWDANEVMLANQMRSGWMEEKPKMPEKTELVKTLKQKFYSNSPDALRVATMSRWSGRMILGPCKKLEDALALMRSSLDSTAATTIPGVYFLTTTKEPKTLYIGQSTTLETRISNYKATLSDWMHFAIASCTDTNIPLTRTDTSYLEWKLIQQVKKSGQIKLENQQSPSLPTIDEDKKLDLDPWLDGILDISLLLGMNYFVANEKRDKSLLHDFSTVFELNLSHRNEQARGKHSGKNFVVLAGSTATGEWTGKSEGNDNAKMLLRELLNNGTIIRNGDGFQFTRDYEFNSSSLAAKVIAGSPRSGPESWIVSGTTTTYKEWYNAGAGADSDTDK